MTGVKCPVHNEQLFCTVDEQALRITVGCSRCGKRLSSNIQPHATVAEMEWYARVLATALVQGMCAFTPARVPSSGVHHFARC